MSDSAASSPRKPPSFELHREKDGQFIATGIFACGKCRAVHRKLEHADACCVRETKEERAARHLRRRQEQESKDAKKWDGAKKYRLDEIDHEKTPSLWLYSDRLDDYFDSVEALVERLDDEGHPHDRVYLCAPHLGSAPDAASIIEDATCDMHEDAYDDVSAAGHAELQTFLDAWWKEHRPSCVEPTNIGLLLA